VTFGVANSLDNYIARRDDSVDWLLWGKEAAEVNSGFWPTIDTVLMGRKTFEAAVRLGQKDGYPGVRNYVFSRTIEPIEGSVKIISSDASEFVRNLKGRAGKGICVMGGGELARSLFEADLIDEVGFNIHPVLLGDGIALFHSMNRQINLELKECKAFTNGCVYVSYRVIHLRA
jgi:dihydrofolate reductase